MERDILAVNYGVIVHQVNCQGVMGAGLALKIRNKYPQVYESYRKYKFSLGQIQLVRINENLFVCNLAGQDRYGRDKQYTDYDAVRTGLEKLWNWLVISESRYDVIQETFQPLMTYIPYKMGCMLGGGDWNIVSKIIEDIFNPYDVTICKLS